MNNELPLKRTGEDQHAALRGGLFMSNKRLFSILDRKISLHIFHFL
ncbi:hypothetical protein QY96_01001 [Bacillus thermotolerans]|nr:hypothetical protein QY96_01001 [Bacillus thermotolerans]